MEQSTHKLFQVFPWSLYNYPSPVWRGTNICFRLHWGKASVQPFFKFYTTKKKKKDRQLDDELNQACGSVWMQTGSTTAPIRHSIHWDLYVMNRVTTAEHCHLCFKLIMSSDRLSSKHSTILMLRIPQEASEFQKNTIYRQIISIRSYASLISKNYKPMFLAEKPTEGEVILEKPNWFQQTMEQAPWQPISWGGVWEGILFLDRL